MARSVRRVAGPPNRRLSEVPRVAAEPPLIDPPLRGPVEGQAPVLQLIDGLDRVFGHEKGGALVHQVVAALHGVEGVPFRTVFLHIAQGRADPALGGPRVAPYGIEFRDDGRPGRLAGLQGRKEPGASRAYDHGIEFVYHVGPPGFGVCCSAPPVHVP